MSTARFNFTDGISRRLAPVAFFALALIVLSAFGLWVYRLIVSSARVCGVW
jgi:hypothetical protein